MSEQNVPAKPLNSFRVTIETHTPRHRIDQILMEELRGQTRNLELQKVTRTQFKELFKNKKIRVKGQAARPSSSLASGTTYVDILGYKDSEI